VGYGAAGGGFFLTHDFPYHPRLRSHEIHLNLVEVFGIKPYFIAPELMPCQHDIDSTQSILHGLSSSHPLAVISPSSQRKNNKWIATRFRTVIDSLNSDGYQILLLGGPRERKELEKIVEDYELDLLQIWNFPTYGEVLALAKYTDLFIGIESGASQIMAAVGTPSIILSKYYSHDASAPIGCRTRTIYPGIPCDSCNDGSAATQNYSCTCLHKISEDEVVIAYRELLEIET